MRSAHSGKWPRVVLLAVSSSVDVLGRIHGTAFVSRVRGLDGFFSLQLEQRMLELFKSTSSPRKMDHERRKVTGLGYLGFGGAVFLLVGFGGTMTRTCLPNGPESVSWWTSKLACCAIPTICLTESNTMERVIESGYYQVWISRPSYFTPLFRQYQTYQCLQGRTVTRKWCTCHTDHTQESVAKK